MQSTPETVLKESAFIFQRSGRNLSSATLYAEVAKHVDNDPGIYTGLGAALAKAAKAAEGADRMEYLTWATKSLKKGLLIGQGGMFESPCVNWLEIIKEEMDVVQPDPLVSSDLDGLLSFLDAHGVDLVADLKQLSEEDQGPVLRGMIEMPRENFLSVALAAAAGDFGEGLQRLVIARIPNFGDHQSIRETLAKVAVHVDSYALQPELGNAMKKIDPEWADQFETD